MEYFSLSRPNRPIENIITLISKGSQTKSICILTFFLSFHIAFF
jgi:hypothetical protein